MKVHKSHCMIIHNDRCAMYTISKICVEIYKKGNDKKYNEFISCCTKYY